MNPLGAYSVHKFIEYESTSQKSSHHPAVLLSTPLNCMKVSYLQDEPTLTTAALKICASPPKIYLYLHRVTEAQGKNQNRL